MVSGVVLLAGSAGYAEKGPSPPCAGGVPVPPYPDLENSPAFQVWERGDLGREWAPPRCTGWRSPGFTTLAVTVARFRYDRGVDGLLHRIEAVSEFAGIRYWSTTWQRWRTLILSAHTVTGPDGDTPRQGLPAGRNGRGETPVL
jgi:hypothetical protein